ncbi:MAG: serine/threonine transporter SstT, partial [Firmicutes bacterium]|nr:serine/threonine transporter SstT [Bacillota bacterium]
MNLIQKWTEISLVKRIVAGLIVGALLGAFLPQAEAIGMLGTLFVNALKALAPLLVFFIVMHALAQRKKGSKGNMGTVVLLYLVGTFGAALVAVIASFLFPSTLMLEGVEQIEQAAPQGILEVLTNLVTGAVMNPIAAITSANFISVLFWAVIFGMAFHNASEGTRTVVGEIADMLSTAIRWVIQCAPFGILGLVFTTVSTTGFKAFLDYGQLLLVLVGSMLFVALVMNPLIVFFCTRKNPYPLVLKCLKDSGIMAFFTRSSAANIPVNMRLCKELGLNEDKYSVSIPLGATINMAGAAITISVLTLATANTLGIQVDFLTALLLSVLSALGACGASGVAGG